MPLVYADTSALFAFFYPRDPFAEQVTSAVRKLSPDFVYWSFLRYELRHNLRQARTDKYGAVAWNALRASERTQARLRWQAELYCDSVLDAAEELSAKHAPDSAAGSADFLHVAAARRINLLSGLDEFWTCDSNQARIASLVGLTIRHFKSKHSRTQPSTA
jgi:predicted nucleic acid-binding protein